MTPPADPRTVLRALVAAGEKATPGEHRYEHGERGAEVWADTSPTGSMLVAVFGFGSFDHDNARLYAAAANARPALAALAGMCVLEVEVVRHLAGACGCRRQWMGGLREGAWPPKHTDAIAAAEAELRAIAEVM